MLFHSFRFLVFFPIVFFLYWLSPFRFRKYCLLAASYYFYMCWKAEFIVLILFSTLADYICSLQIAKNRGRRALCKIFLAVSLCVNLGLLFFFKYFNFFGETLTAFCRALSIPFSAPVLDVILPVGISFYSFQTLSYTIDVYQGKMEPERDFISFALFVSFFPQLVAGPIERASSLLPRLKTEHTFSYEDATYGLKLMAWGFFKKLVIADQLAMLFVDPVYHDPGADTGGAFLIATAAFAIQIYCDFSGYSDIARGCAKTMGIDLMVNFKAPYLAVSVRDFWRRWHISLTNWFRDYVYIPMGGNRRGLRRRMLFPLITFTLSGLWHGASWTFVIWGVSHALFLNLETLLARGRGGASRVPFGTLPGRCVTLMLVCFAWIFFRADTLSGAFGMLGRCLAGLRNPALWWALAHQTLYPGKILLASTLFSLLLLLLFDLSNERRDTIQMISNWPGYIRWPVYIAFTLLLILLIPKESAEPFIYFQF